MIRHMTLCAVAALTLAACSQPEPAAAPTETAPPATTRAATPAAETPASNANVLTAEGFGPLRIGMTLAEVTTAYGPDSNPEAVGGPDPASCDQFRPERAPEGLLVMIQEGRLTRISLSDNTDIKTDRGFGVGDAATAIKTTYGDAARVTPHKYSEAPAEDVFVWAAGAPAQPTFQDLDARGIRYEIGSDGKVQNVHVGGPAIQLVEGCA